MLGCIFIEVRDSGFGSAGIQRVRGARVIIVFIAVFLKVLLLRLDFVDFFLDLLNFPVDLPVATAV